MSQSYNVPRGAFTRGVSVVVACGLMLGLASPLLAQTAKSVPTAQQLLDALKSKSTRSVGPAAKVNPAVAAKEAQRIALIAQLKTKAQRGLSNGGGGGAGSSAALSAGVGTGSVLNVTERKQLAEAVKGQPSVNMEVPFAFDSAEIGPDAVPVLTSLGQALQDGSIKSSDFLLAGHTDAKGKPEYNQSLSQRRADAVRDYLVKNFTIGADKLVSVGYGRERLKDAARPFADVNRRVQVVNISPTPTASTEGVSAAQ